MGGPGSEVAMQQGLALIMPAPNPSIAPSLDVDIMKGSLGSTENGPYDVFFINNSAGGRDRTVEAAIGSSLSYSMLQPTANPNPAHFALYAYLGEPPSYLNLTLPSGIGPALWVPCSATPGNPIGLLVTNSTFADPCPQLVASTPTPWHFEDTVGIPFPITVTFYGIIQEPALKVTNAIVLKIQ